MRTVVGAMAVDRIATALGGKCVFPVLAPMLVQVRGRAP